MAAAAVQRMEKIKIEINEKFVALNASLKKMN